MKTYTLTALLMSVVLPVALLGSSTTDRQIEEAAKASYNYRTVLDGNVKAKSNDGIVTLTGKVEDQSDKTLAADTVSDMPGVVRVNNEIEVANTHKEYSDGWIALKIRGVLLTKANVSAMDSQVQVENGNVTLTGKADNQAQKELTEVYAKEIQGVKSVTNQITVVAPVVSDHRTDERRSVAVNTDGQRNDNMRNAGSRNDRARIHTMGNDSVRNDHMRNDGMHSYARHNDDMRHDYSRTIGDRIDDSSITAQVKAALLGHRSTNALTTNITTKDGVVAVSGVASSDAEKSLVTKLAEGIRGVKSVNNSMTVEPVVASK
jgi:osmotically-inducible protein OsmY